MLAAACLVKLTCWSCGYACFGLPCQADLLDVWLAGCAGGKITGDVRINGHPQRPETFMRVMGYVEQTDVHMVSFIDAVQRKDQGILKQGFVLRIPCG